MLWVRGVNGLADGLRVNFLGCLSEDECDVSTEEPADAVDDEVVFRLGLGGVDCGGVGCWSGTC